MWLHNTSDVLIGLAYFAIPVLLLYFLSKRKDLPFPRMFALFGLFILLCGSTHVLEAYTTVEPVYRLSGFFKVMTAAVSILTAIQLAPLIPKAMALRSPDELEKLNVKLQGEVKERVEAESALARHSAELRTANKNLARSNEELEQYAYLVSHDLQEPLRTLTSYATLLREGHGDALDEDGTFFVEQLVGASTRMHTLIQELLAYARLANEGPQHERISLAALVEEARGNLAPAIEESGAEISHGDLPRIFADRAQMLQLLQNLLGNALKYRASDHAPRIEIVAEEDDGEVRFGVRDDGIGIDEKDQDKIFRLFRRLHSQDTYEGTGVGLAFCRRLVEQHDGRIWVESRPGAGSTFWVALPRYDGS